MRAVVIVLALAHGYASQFSKGVMEEVVHNRTNGKERVVQLASHPAYRPIAVVDCARLNENVLVRYADYPWEMATVVDCARPGDGTTEWMERNNILLEMGFQRAQELDIVGRGIRVEVVRKVELVVDGPCPGPCLVKEEW